MSFEISLTNDIGPAGSLVLRVPTPATLAIDLPLILRGMRGIQGEKGDPGDAGDIGDLSALFASHLTQGTP